MYNDSLFNAFARLFEARRETDMPIAEYLESCRGDPMRFANAAERILAAIGDPQMIDAAKDPRLGRIFLNRTIRVYPDDRANRLVLPSCGAGAGGPQADSL